MQTNTNFDVKTKSNLNRWLNGNYDEATKDSIRQMLSENPKEIEDAFYTDLSFGTGGLRGIMGVGSNRMNNYTVRRCTQGLANYINGYEGSNKTHTVLIGYDSRHHSKEFAEESAKVLAANGIHVLIYSELRPVASVSFGCRFKKCTAAVMITASHNPAIYNGYKVYWSDGGQVVPPHDQEIIDKVNAITDLAMVKTVDTLSHPLITWIDDEIDIAYIETVSHLQQYREDNAQSGPELKVVYTSLHGTGITLVPKVLERWGFTNLQFVEKQIIPDGDFPTVAKPNPEEREALKLGIEMLEKTGGDILIANDPDADRVGVAVAHKGSIELITGNQMAALLLNHISKALSARKKMPANAAFVKSIVTTELFAAICNYYQKPSFNVLPGFKYIAEKIAHWEEQRGHQYVFGGEESYGYLFGTYARDKDAIAMSAVICEMANQAKKANKTLIDELYELYEQFGVYEEVLYSIDFQDSKEGKEAMQRAMQLLRCTPPKKILDVSVISLEDYQRLTKTDFATKQVDPLHFPQSDVLLFWLEDKTKLVIRPSGTEPKIKVYCGIVRKNASSIKSTLDECHKKAFKFIEALKSRFET